MAATTHGRFSSSRQHPLSRSAQAIRERAVVIRRATLSYHTPEGQQKKKLEEERIERPLLSRGYVKDAANDDAAPGSERGIWRGPGLCSLAAL